MFVPVDETWPHRGYCYQCRRPDLVCVCAHIRPVPTRIELVILQHPRESRRSISTARIVSLSIPGCSLFIGVNFTHHAGLARRLAEAKGRTYLVYPERGAPNLTQLAEQQQNWPDAPPLFVILDGTWAQARKIKNQNPVLDALPRVGLSPQAPSRYRIRTQPRPMCLSTVEATVLLLGDVDPPVERFQPLLDVFDRMVEKQLSFKKGHPGRGIRRPEPRPWAAAR
jgi:DTW domain-containing protein YfiP